MRDHAIVDGTVRFLDLWAPFPRWINRHRKGREERCYSAKAISRFSADGLALAVEMSGSDGLIATYKCNIHEVRGRRKSWIVASRSSAQPALYGAATNERCQESPWA